MCVCVCVRVCVCVCVCIHIYTCVCVCVAWGNREADTERGNKDTNSGSNGRVGAFINVVPAGII